MRIRTHARLRDGETCTLAGPGVIAFDGDRLHALGAGDAVHITVRRDGPWIIDTTRCLDLAAREGRLGTQPRGQLGTAPQGQPRGAD